MNQENKKKGSKYTKPQTLRTPKGSSYSSWSKSLEGQFNHLHDIREEAKKASVFNNYTPKVKITNRFKEFFDDEVVEARRKAKQKQKRNNK